MSARKLQQEVDRTFKRVSEGIQQFESIYDKLQHCTNASQKERLEDSLKREIKKLQRHRDQIKTWAANSEIKDKKPLLDERKKIETQMEKFKAVEKEMKTKAYSKEGLLASQRLDPKAQQKQDMINFLSDQTAELDRQIEVFEAEAERIEVSLKRGKKDTSKADRVAEVERKVEHHKWHQTKLELIMRLLENGRLEVESVERIKEDIKWYIESNQDVDWDDHQDDTIYDELNLDEEAAEDIYGMGLDAERMSSQDTTSVQDDLSERPSSTKESSNGGGRRPSAQLKSPVPTPAVPVPPGYANGSTNGSSMKPAPLPARPAGELKYASVATAAAAAEKSVGIAPLPPPPGMSPVVPTGPAGMSPLPPPNAPKQPARQGSSPAAAPAVPISTRPIEKVSTPASEKPATTPSPKTAAASVTPPSEPSQSVPPSEPEAPDMPEASAADETSSLAPKHELPSEKPPIEAKINGTNGTNGTYSHTPESTEPAQEECVYHLPPGLQDLMSSFESTKKRLLPTHNSLKHALEVSYCNAPDTIDAEKPKHYRPTQKYNTPAHYPQEPLAIFDDPALYRRIDTDTLFYVFYYRQGTYQQYLAAKELKRQSWRFHKQYQTWFQRHEEPKTITEEYEQGTYRFFDYESTWMNRRKSDFKFAYKYLEDDL